MKTALFVALFFLLQISAGAANRAQPPSDANANANANVSASASASTTTTTTTTASWTTVHGHRLYYQSSGSGRPLLLLHGGGASIEESFARQLDNFAATHRVIAPEQVGQGHSPDVAGPLSYRAMMEDTAALLRQLHLTNVDVVGWSDGGILALMLAAYHPELVGRAVISGANIAPAGLLEADLTQMRSAEQSAPAIAASTMADKLRRLWLYSPTVDELNPRLLSHIHKPVLVLAGDRDVIKLDHTLAIYRALPEAKLSILSNTGHATFAEKPDIVNPLILTFLAQR
ncbi:MAG TPA: alpha/beta hydrolase [Spongiibacteraceae bacterium]|nr:alpha/beta hydrolase [Spongiibacteraceae bacterium]